VQLTIVLHQDDLAEIGKRGYEEAACTDPKLPFLRCKRWAAALPRKKSGPARR
jgi:hypothetical protein